MPIAHPLRALYAAIAPPATISYPQDLLRATLSSPHFGGAAKLTSTIASAVVIGRAPRSQPRPKRLKAPHRQVIAAASVVLTDSILPFWMVNGDGRS
jgi:hypothetical protein